MRRIKFRGICVMPGECEGKWLYGDLIQKNNKVFITPRSNSVKVDNIIGRLIVMREVKPETVGQYTGLRDKNGGRIYEGDILNVFEVMNTKAQEYTSPVEFIDSGFLVTEPNGTQVPLACFHNLQNSYPLMEIEIVGNIHEPSGGEQA